MSALAPLGSAMKPKPFLLLNHLTIPWGMQVDWFLTRYSAPAAVYGGAVRNGQLLIGKDNRSSHVADSSEAWTGTPVMAWS
jgi:hypothetical protein